jgi:hypothetical protein
MRAGMPIAQQTDQRLAFQCWIALELLDDARTIFGDRVRSRTVGPRLRPIIESGPAVRFSAPIMRGLSRKGARQQALACVRGIGIVPVS